MFCSQFAVGDRASVGVLLFISSLSLPCDVDATPWSGLYWQALPGRFLCTRFWHFPLIHVHGPVLPLHMQEHEFLVRLFVLSSGCLIAAYGPKYLKFSLFALSKSDVFSVSERQKRSSSITAGSFRVRTAPDKSDRGTSFPGLTPPLPKLPFGLTPPLPKLPRPWLLLRRCRVLRWTRILFGDVLEDDGGVLGEIEGVDGLVSVVPVASVGGLIVLSIKEKYFSKSINTSYQHVRPPKKEI